MTGSEFIPQTSGALQVCGGGLEIQASKVPHNFFGAHHNVLIVFVVFGKVESEAQVQ